MLNYIDLFAGCGGLSEGFYLAGGYTGLAHVEWEKPMINTLRNRLMLHGASSDEAKQRVCHFDIQNTNELIFGTDQINTLYEDNDNLFLTKGLAGVVGSSKVDLVIGGPPCQAYSIAGRAQDKNSMRDDYRNYLFESFAKVVDHFKPKLFIFENVPGILSATPGNIPVLDRIHKSFEDIGYIIRPPERQKLSLFNSNDFNVAQNRKRVIIVGIRRELNIPLESVYEMINETKSKVQPVVKDVISDLPKLLPISTDNSKISHKQNEGEFIPFHSPRKHNHRDIQIFKEWVKNGMNQLPTSEKLKFYTQKTSRTSNHNKYRNLEWDKPSPTIVAHLKKDGLMFIHPDEEQARSITVKEAARIQSFPDDFEFIGSQGDQYKMIGNAVPPLMAKNIALALKSFL